jgi:hypothetical protein
MAILQFLKTNEALNTSKRLGPTNTVVSETKASLKLQVFFEVLQYKL